MYKSQRPLPQSEITVIAEDLDWSDLQWGEQSVVVRLGEERLERFAPLKNYKYFPLA